MIQYLYQNGSYYRSDRFEPITVEMSTLNSEFKFFYEECVNQAVNIYKYNSDAYLALSGGINSQLILESYAAAGLKPKVLLLKFPDNINSFDTGPALKSCQEYGIMPLVIEFHPNLFTNEYLCKVAVKYQLYTYIDCVFAHLAETLPIQLFLADSIDIRRDSTIDRSWNVILNESDLWIKRFNLKNKNRVIINHFFTTPTILKSMLNLKTIQDLINNKFHGKISFLTSRKQTFTEAGFQKIKNFTRTDTTYYVGKHKEYFEDKFYKTTLFESRKLYISCNDIITLNGFKKWTFV